MTPKQRFQAAHRSWYEINHPVIMSSGHYPGPQKMPDCTKANGLTQAIVKFLLWSGHRSTRINSTGRIIKAPQRQASGVSLMTAKYIPGTTRRGAADVSSTIHGRSVMWEVKAGRDLPSEYQLREQALERSAGGEYFFVHSFEEFLNYYDVVCA